MASVRQVGFPRLGAEMEICGGGLLRSVLRSKTCKRKGNKIGRGEDYSGSRGLSQSQARSEAREAFHSEMTLMESGVVPLCL